MSQTSLHNFRFSFMDPSISEGIVIDASTEIDSLQKTKKGKIKKLDEAPKRKMFLERQSELKKKISDLGGALVVNSGKIVRAELDALVKIREIIAELEELEKEFDASIHLENEKREVTTILRDFPAEIDAIMSAIHTLEEKKLRFENHAKTLRDPLLLTSVMAENEGKTQNLNDTGFFTISNQIRYLVNDICAPEKEKEEILAENEEPDEVVSISLTAGEYDAMKDEYRSLMNEFAIVSPKVQENEKKIAAIKKDIGDQNKKHAPTEREVEDLIHKYTERKVKNPKCMKSITLISKEGQLRLHRENVEKLEAEKNKILEELTPQKERLLELKERLGQIRIMFLLSEHKEITAPEPECSYLNQLEMHRHNPYFHSRGVVGFAGYEENIHFFCSKRHNYEVLRGPELDIRGQRADGKFISDIPLVSERADAFLDNRAVNGDDDRNNNNYIRHMAALVDEPRASISKFPNSIGWAWRLHDLATMFAREDGLLAGYLGTTWGEVVNHDDFDAQHTGYPQERAEKCVSWAKKLLNDEYALKADKGLKGLEKREYVNFISGLSRMGDYSLFVSLSRIVVDLPLTHMLTAFFHEHIDLDSKAILTSHRDDVMGHTDAIARITKLKDTVYYYLIDFSFKDKSKESRKVSKIPDYQRLVPNTLRKNYWSEPYDFYLGDARRITREYVDWYWGCVEQFGEVHDDWIVAKMKSLDVEKSIIGQIDELIADAKT